MKKYHDIQNLSFTKDSMTLCIDGIEQSFKLSECSPRLSHATEIEKNTYEMAPSGYGIHWPLIDEDLSIDGLLDIVHSPQRKPFDFIPEKFQGVIFAW